MTNRLHSIAETQQFIRDAADAGLSEDQVKEITDTVSSDPLQGVEVQGSGGVRKIRVGGRGKGKSGGYRVMVAYVGEDAPTYLLALLSKGDRDTFTDRETAAMKAFTTAVRQNWRERKKRP